jgi:hypothetical protein
MARVILAAFAMLVSASVMAADRSYAVMSLVGDGLLVVQYRGKTGSSLSGRQRQAIPVADPVFDRTALLAVEAAVKRAQPKSEVILLAGRDAGLLDVQSKGLGSNGAAQAIADALVPRLPKTEATHLIIVTKAQSASALRVDQSVVDTGPLEGLGFYVDPSIVTRPPEGSAASGSQGLLAPFAYFDVALVDLASGKVVGERPVYASYSYVESQTGSLSPWEALSSQEKMRILTKLEGDEVGKAVDGLLGSTK